MVGLPFASSRFQLKLRLLAPFGRPENVIGLVIELAGPRFVHVTAPALSVVDAPTVVLHVGTAAPVVPVPLTDVTLSKLPLESRTVVPTVAAVDEGHAAVVGIRRLPEESNVSVPVLPVEAPVKSPDGSETS